MNYYSVLECPKCYWSIGSFHFHLSSIYSVPNIPDTVDIEVIKHLPGL